MRLDFAGKFISWVFAGVLLVACGGGGGGGSSSSSTGSDSELDLSLTLSFDIKQLQFEWTEDPEATFYRLLENPDGVSGFTQIGEDLSAGEAETTRNISVHLHDWANARYMLEACNANGCRDSNEVATALDGSVQSIGYLKAPNIVTSHKFGYSVATSADGATLAVGAPGESSDTIGIDGQFNNDAPDSGAVYIYNGTNGVWNDEAVFVKAPNAEVDDSFGADLALSADGSVLAVGASSEHGNGTDLSDNSVDGAGAVYVYRRGDDGWAYETYLKAEVPAVSDTFGGAIALSGDGNVLAVGVPGDDSADPNDPANDGASDAGAIYVFRYADGGWQAPDYVKASNIDQADQFGVSVALNVDGSVMAVGAPHESSDGQPGNNDAALAGAAYVYAYDGDNWGAPAYLKAADIGANAQFGLSVALDRSGQTLVVGADNEGNSGFSSDDAGAGAAYVYTQDGDTWGNSPLHLTPPYPESRDRFGFTVAVSADGDTLAVGATGESSAAKGIGGDDTAPGTTTADVDSLIGATYVYRRTADGWTDIPVYVKATNTPTVFGFSIDMNADGSIMVIGAPWEGSDTASVEGSQMNFKASASGAVYSY